MSSYVILSIFFSHFYLVLIQDIGVLEKLYMVFKTFCNIFISSHVILVFPKHNNSRVFWCNSRRNHSNRKTKSSLRFEKTLDNYEWRFKRPLKKLQEGEILLTVPRKVIWNKTPKGQRNRQLRAKKKKPLVRPRVWSRHPGYDTRLLAVASWRRANTTLCHV